MDITPLVAADRQIIQSYSAKGFKVSGTAHEGAVAVFTDRTEAWDYQGDVSGLTETDFAIVTDRADEIDVVLLGTGKTMSMLSPDISAALKAKGLNVESMDSGAASRTYNVLMTEGRRVVALLLPL